MGEGELAHSRRLVDRFLISQIEKGYALRRNPLILLAPRPGLEPGTYGLTGGRSDRAAGRANAHFRGSGLPILSSRSLRFLPGESAGSTTGYWKAFRLECLVVRLCCFVDLGIVAEQRHAPLARQIDDVRVRPDPATSGHPSCQKIATPMTGSGRDCEFAGEPDSSLSGDRLS
jgi:hypothetical protein